MMKIIASRVRVHLAGASIRAGNGILAAELRRWNLSPIPGWRVPNTSH